MAEYLGQVYTQEYIEVITDALKTGDLSLSDPSFRRRHRKHLSAALAAVKQMLDLRATHTGGNGKLDLIILPELSVHPRDVVTHLVPFARAYKTVILAGLTYEEVFPGEPLGRMSTTLTDR